MNRFSEMLGMSARVWYLVDCRDQVVGRIGQQVSTILQGKTKATYCRSADMGDYVVVINSRHCVLTGKKWDQKVYQWHTGYAGGLNKRNARYMHEKNPTDVLRRAIYGFLPKNKLRPKMMKRLLIFPDDVHPYKDNISFVLAGPTTIYKKLSDYTPEETLQVPVMVDPGKFLNLEKNKELLGDMEKSYSENRPDRVGLVRETSSSDQ